MKIIVKVMASVQVYCVSENICLEKFSQEHISPVSPVTDASQHPKTQAL